LLNRLPLSIRTSVPGSKPGEPPRTSSADSDLCAQETEEAGIRSTGIGCYFDDPVHEVFGISSQDWQSFYHFTVGGPVEDGRLTTLPAYDREEER